MSCESNLENYPVPAQSHSLGDHGSGDQGTGDPGTRYKTPDFGGSIHTHSFSARYTNG